jgi:hypothetical protein
MKTTIASCKVCGSGGEGELFAAKEMMFGLRDTFEYLLCRGCGSLQLNNVPDNMQRIILLRNRVLSEMRRTTPCEDT